ncbi:MAG: glycosyltransferase, partial [Phycisphaerales bacterium JB050]
DFICCATTDDERHLTELGNKAKATGLPRLDDLQPSAPDFTGPDPAGPVLIATANTPWFNDRERTVLIDALRELKQVATDRGIPVRWRLTGGLDRLLGVENHPGTITEALSGGRALISTPSTLLLEASLMGLPVAVLDPFAQPVLEGMSGVLRSANAPELLDALGARPEWTARAYPPSQTGSTAASLVADRIAEIARTPGRTEASAPFLPTVRLPREVPRSARPRVVSAIVCDGSPTSGVTTFSLRMSAESAHRDSGWEWHTLLIQTQPKNAANDGLRELEPEKLGHVHVCTLDPTADHHETLKACRAAIERLHPDVLAPNFSDMAWAIAAQLRFTGVRTLGIMHSDDEAYRTTLRDRPIWDAGIGVSAACTEQMRKIGAEVFDDPPPIEQVTYGVPVAEAVPPRPADGPIRLLYVGRLVEHQKRVSRLIELATHLRALGCEFTLDLIGDGPSEPALHGAIQSEGLSETVRLRGRLTPEEVQAELDRADGLVLVSDFEGTSIAMLEAMGRGVLPCVSEVASGVSEWVRDGENGVSAPVGDVRGLAAKIAGMGEDRQRLRRMQHAAWETVRERGSIGVMFDRYQRVLDACLNRPLRTKPSDLGLYLTEGGRWLKTWSDDPTDAKRYARRVLEEAGFRNIASDEPEDSSDAVILDTSKSLEPTQRIEAWRARGLGVACVPLIIDRPGWVRLDAAVRFAVRNGAERVALYGAGQHTQRALPMLVRHLPIVGVIDDRPQVDFLAGIPVVRPDEAIDRLRCEAVVLSSDTIEGTLWQASRALRERGIAVYSLYADYSEEPVASVTA